MKAPCENITPYSDSQSPDAPESKEKQIERMFDNIAPGYDLLNKLMTMGIDRLWRRAAVKEAGRDRPRYILDVATGTADMAIQMARRIDPLEVAGIDLSDKMLEIGRRKMRQAGLDDTITLQQADSLAMPFTDSRFDCITCAFGVRNFADLLAGYREMLRVMRPGGKLVILELSVPRGKVTNPLYNFYAGKVIPAVGRLISADNAAYSYLPESIGAVPQGADMTALIAEAGFEDAAFRPFTFGACTLYTARKPLNKSGNEA